MDAGTEPGRPGWLATLRPLARGRAPVEPCELCNMELATDHQHLIDPANRQLLCCCDACAILFSDRVAGRYRRVPRRVRFLPDFQLTDADWESLMIPIKLAFFFHSSVAGRVVALYPSPSGATESLLPLAAWETLVEENAVLRDLEPDVEALLVNRTGRPAEYYRAPIDECYKLVGLIRTYWRGLSGGTEVWRETGRFFAGLKERSHA